MCTYDIEENISNSEWITYISTKRILLVSHLLTLIFCTDLCIFSIEYNKNLSREAFQWCHFFLCFLHPVIIKHFVAQYLKNDSKKQWSNVYFITISLKSQEEEHTSWVCLFVSFIFFSLDERMANIFFIGNYSLCDILK